MVFVPWSSVWGSWLLKVPYLFTQREREREGGRESERERERERKIERERERETMSWRERLGVSCWLKYNRYQTFCSKTSGSARLLP